MAPLQAADRSQGADAMANVTRATNFWKILKSISVAEIAREANRPISIAVVGPADVREEAVDSLFEAQEATGEQMVSATRRPAEPFLQVYDSASEEAGFPHQPGVFDFVIDVGSGREGVPDGTVVYSVAEIGGWEQTLERILDDRPDLLLPLARSLPVFRRRASQRIIAQTATANAQFALITGVAEAIPIANVFLPVSAVSDIIVLTKNQTMMVLRLAAAHGLPVEYKSRTKEVAPILANAFGWRAVARELVGAIPMVGFLARAMIAYAGTVTVGKAAQLYYETGESVTKAQAKRIYREAYEASREKVRALAANLRSRGALKASDALDALPEPANDASPRLAAAAEQEQEEAASSLE
jgi:uncharacterized protein (DUF697 family)